jgi:hypothetical protein
LDPQTKMIVLVVGESNAALNGMLAGIYLLEPDSPTISLQRAGDWASCNWEPGGRFIIEGTPGVFVYGEDAEAIYLPDEGHARLSPGGNWMVGWGDGVGGKPGARLYQSSSSKPLQELSEEPVKEVFWQPNSKGFFLLGEAALYHLEFPALDLAFVDEGFRVDDFIPFIWVE